MKTEKNLLAALLFLPALAFAGVPGESGGVYIAGEGFTLEQAAAEALESRRGPPDPAAVLVLGREVSRLAAKDNRHAALLGRLAAAGIPVYVCERDLSRGGLAPAALPAGVRVARGWTAAEAQGDAGVRSAPEGAPPESMLRRIRRICSGD